MRDVAFYFKKKSGFPKLTDSGLADVLLGGEGLTVTAHVVSADKDKSSVFKVKNVNVKVATLKFSIRDSKHDTFYKILRPLATGLVKRQLQKAIADAVTTGLEYVDGQLVGVRDRMAEAKTTLPRSGAKYKSSSSFSSKTRSSVSATELWSSLAAVSASAALCSRRSANRFSRFSRHRKSSSIRSPAKKLPMTAFTCSIS